MDDRDDRRGAAVDRLEHAAQRVRVGDVRVEVEVDRAAHPLDVRTGAEARPVPREHDGPRGADVDERLGELGDQRGVERVARLRPREGDAEDVAVPLDAERSHEPEPRVCAMAAKRFTVELERVQNAVTIERVRSEQP